jgi:hypothetical protein
MKKLLVTALAFSIPTVIFASCTDQERIDMLNAGVSPEFVRKACEYDLGDVSGAPVEVDAPEEVDPPQEVERKETGSEAETESLPAKSKETERIEELERQVQNMRMQGMEQRIEELEQEKLPGYWREQQPYGLGYGIIIGRGLGSAVYFDYNLNDVSQVHVQFTTDTSFSFSFSGSTIDVTQSVFFGSYRRFLSRESGWFAGGGIGSVTTKLEYHYEDFFTGEDYDYNAEATGVGLLLDAGWQGDEDYYFTFGVQPMAVVTATDEFDVSRIPDVSNHRSYTQERWDEMQSSTKILFGFGWFFGD